MVRKKMPQQLMPQCRLPSCVRAWGGERLSPFISPRRAPRALTTPTRTLASPHGLQDASAQRKLKEAFQAQTCVCLPDEFHVSALL